jgi:hypothetical protein
VTALRISPYFRLSGLIEFELPITFVRGNEAVADDLLRVRPERGCFGIEPKEGGFRSTLEAAPEKTELEQYLPTREDVLIYMVVLAN